MFHGKSLQVAIFFTLYRKVTTIFLSTLLSFKKSMPAARREGKSLDLGNNSSVLMPWCWGWVLRLTFPGWRGPNIQDSDFILCQCNEPWVIYRWFLLWIYVTYQRLRCFSVINRIHGETWSSLILSSLDRFTLAIWIPGNKIQAPLGMWKTKVALSQNVSTASAHNSFLSLRPFGHASKKICTIKIQMTKYSYLFSPSIYSTPPRETSILPSIQNLVHSPLKGV